MGDASSCPQRANDGVGAHQNDRSALLGVDHAPDTLGQPQLWPTAHYPPRLEQAPATHHTGRWDRIVVRAFQEIDIAALCDAFPHLVEPSGSITIVEVDPAAGTRPSTVLELPEELGKLLSRAETALASTRIARWQEELSRHGTLTVRSSNYRQTLTRQVTPSMVTRWLANGSPLGDELSRTASQKDHAQITALGQKWHTRPIQWERGYNFLTISQPQT